MNPFFHHYADEELPSMEDVSIRRLNWTAISWDLKAFVSDVPHYAQIVVGPGVFLTRTGSLEERPFTAGETLQHLERSYYEEGWGNTTMVDAAVEQNIDYETQGFNLHTPPFIIEFPDLAEKHESDCIHSLGDLLIRGNSETTAEVFERIRIQRDSIRA